MTTLHPADPMPYIIAHDNRVKLLDLTPFRQHQEVAAVEHEDAGNPLESGAVHYGTVTEARLCSVTARFGDGNEQLFLLDSRGSAWRESGRLRLVPVCRCDEPITGTPVTDQSGHPFCTEDCRDDDAATWAGQHYGAGVAT